MLFFFSHARIEQYYEAILALWNQLYINMKSLVSWHYCMIDIEKIRAMTIAKVRHQLALPADQRLDVFCPKQTLQYPVQMYVQQNYGPSFCWVAQTLTHMEAVILLEEKQNAFLLKHSTDKQED